MSNDFLTTFLEEAQEILLLWEASCLRLDTEVSQENLDGLFRQAHNLKGSARSVGLADLGSFVHAAEDLLVLLKEGKTTWDAHLSKLLFSTHRLLEEWVQGLLSDAGFIPLYQPLLQSLMAHQEHKATASAALAAEKGYAIFAEEEVDLPTPTLSTATTARQGTRAAQGGKGAKAPVVDPSLRVAASRIAQLLQNLGEMSVQLAMLAHCHRQGDHSPQTFGRSLELCEKINTEFQDAVLRLRMQPVDSLFQRLERVASDAAKDLGKPFQFVTSGRDVELDKIVLERIVDPLVHIVRNSVDHGLEAPEARRTAGKPETGRVEIAATQTGAGVTLRITDDGRGMDPAALLAKARERGLVNVNDKSQPTKGEILNFVFLPGFSTAEKVTNISGRGVGMDVVRTAIADLNGSIELDSHVGRGTTITINLPVSLSIVDGLVVSVDGELYAVPLGDVTRVVDLVDFEVATSTNTGRMLQLGSSIVPLEDLGDYVVVGKRRDKTATRRLALIVSDRLGSLALAVDQIAGQQRVIISSLNQKMEAAQGLSGWTIFADGQPAMILHLADVSRTFFAANARPEVSA